MRSRLRGDSKTYMILKVLGAAAATGVAVTAFAAFPGLAVMAQGVLEYAEDRQRRAWARERQRIQEAIRRLANRRLVRYEERGKETVLVITKRGIEEVRKFSFEELALPRAPAWDGAWRLIMFDIPEKRKRGREVLREKLVALGCCQLQKSVFVYPYECRDEVDFIANFCAVDRYVEYVTCGGLGESEVRVRKHFGLLLAKAAGEHLA